MKTNVSIHKIQTDMNQMAKTNRVLALRHLAIEKVLCQNGARMLWMLGTGRLMTSIYKAEVEIMKEGKPTASGGGK